MYLCFSFSDSRGLAALGLAMGLAAATPLSADAASLPGIFAGEAFASRIQGDVSSLSASSSSSARTVLGCLGTEGKTLAKGVRDLSIGSGGSILSANAVSSTAFSDETSTGAVARDTATILGLRALGGMITADSVRAVASLSATAERIDVTSGAAFVNLRIAGRLVPSNVPQNTRFALPNLGSVLVKGVKTAGGPTQSSAGVQVEMLRIDIQNQNRFGLPVGAVMTVGSAGVHFERVELDAVVGGNAAGTRLVGQLTAPLRAKSGGTAPVFMTCRGTNGKLISNELASQNIPGVLSTGDITNTAISRHVGGGVTAAAVTSDVENVSLLSGLIHINSIHAVTTDIVQNGQRTSSTAGSRVSGLTIAGIPTSASQPNTRIGLPGFGVAVVNEQLPRASDTRQTTVVNGIRVLITVASNPLGLPSGTEITVGHAEGVAFPVQVASGAGS